MTAHVLTESPLVGLSVACGLLGLTRDAWYKSHRRGERQSMEQAIVVQEALRLRRELPGCGGRKLLHLMQGFLRSHGLRLGRDKFFELLGEHGLLVKKKKRRRVTTNPNHPFRRYANLVGGLEAGAPNRLWVSDITYVEVGACFSYLSLVTDAHSRKVVGWALERTLQASGPIRALRQALRQWGKRGQLCHHSDRGIQYCSGEYTKLLRKHGIAISMTQNGDPGENALAERVNGTIKGEFLEYWFHGNHEAAQEAVARAINNYNDIRPHESLGYRTPSEVHGVI